MLHSKRSGLLTLLLCLSLAQSANALDIPSPQEVLSNFGINAEQTAQLDKGAIIAYEVTENSDKELGIGVAMYVAAPLPKVVDYLKQGKLGSIDSDIIASWPLSDNADINGFKKFAFAGKTRPEIDQLLKEEPGDDFNLSSQEIDSLKVLNNTLQQADDKTKKDAVIQKYREILLERFQAYRKSGLTGIAPYSRGGDKKADPANELRSAIQHSAAWSKYFPALQQAWLSYPSVALPSGSVEQYFLINRKVEGRPTAILNHRVIVANEAGGMLLSRQFFVGHSYNSSQVVAGGLPYRDGTLMFYSTRSSTDQVAGMGSSLKHSIGRDQVKKAMVNNLNRLSKALQGK